MWLDPFTLIFKNGVQLPARRRIELADNLSVEDDPANDRLIISAAGSTGEFGTGDIETTGDIHAGGGLFLNTYIVTGMSSYTVDSRGKKDIVLLVDTSTQAVTINLPAHAEGRLLFIKNWKATGSTHAITVHRNGGSGRINTVPADLGLGIRDYTVLLSDGIDNWEDLVITGT